LDSDKNLRYLEIIISKPRNVDNTLLGFNSVGEEVCSIGIKYMVTGDVWRAQYTLQEITAHVIQVGGICAWYRQCYGIEYMDSLHRTSATFARHVLDHDHNGQFFNEFYARVLNLYTSYPGLGLECNRYQFDDLNSDENCHRAGDDCGESADGVRSHCISVYNHDTMYCGSCEEFSRFSTEGSWSPVENFGSSTWKDVDEKLENGLSTCRTAAQLCVFVVVVLVISSLSCCLTVDPMDEDIYSTCPEEDEIMIPDDLHFFE